MAAAEQGKFESSTAKTAMLRRYSSRFDSAMRMTTTTKFVLMVVVMVCAMHVRETAGEACGRRLKYLTAADSMALLTSPSYPNDYENNEHCQWVLTAPEGFRDPIVQLESVATDLVNWDNGDCEDYLAVYDGLDSTKPLLKKWCGKEKAVIRSSGKTVLVVFHTDSHLTSRGFALKYYSMQKYSSKCDPERTVNLETSFNPIFVDLPSYTGIDNAPERVQCRYLFTSNENDRGLVLTLELHSAIECEDGNFTIYDGPSESSPKIVSWCYGTKPFEAITTHSSQALVTFTLLRPDLSWHVLRLRAVTRSLQTGCSDNIIPTVQVSSEPTFISFPYTTIVRGNTPCSLRLWASGRYQTLKLDLVNSTKSDLQCGDRGLEFFDGYMKDKEKSLGEACKKTTVRSLTHNMVISPGPSFPSDKPILLRVVALDYPCNNNTERRRAESDKIETLPSLSTNTSGYPNDAQCRYLLSAFRVVDAVEVEVQGRMVPRGDVTCKGDYIAFYDGETSSAKELKRWCGANSRRATVTSSGRHLLVEVKSDYHDNQYDGFTLEYYSVPASGRCERRTELTVNSTWQRLTSPNYPFYYPINTHCEWVLTAPEGETVVLKVIKSEMEGDCSDIVRVYDGKEKSLEGSLGRWCANEAPQYASTGRHLLVIFTADDRWNTGGFEAHFSIDDAGISTGSVWAIVGGLLAAVIIIVLVVIIVVLYMRHWRTEQRKI